MKITFLGIGLVVLIFYVAIHMVPADAQQTPQQVVTPVTRVAKTPAELWGTMEGPAMQYMRSRGFTAKDATRAMGVAAHSDPALGTHFDVLQRMVMVAITGLSDELTMRSIGVTYAGLREAMGSKNAEFEFPHLNAELRLQILCIAAEMS